jgi:hypothetical protein
MVREGSVTRRAKTQMPAWEAKRVEPGTRWGPHTSIFFTLRTQLFGGLVSVRLENKTPERENFALVAVPT